jgi:hypothetical protein
MAELETWAIAMHTGDAGTPKGTPLPPWTGAGAPVDNSTLVDDVCIASSPTASNPCPGKVGEPYTFTANASAGAGTYIDWDDGTPISQTPIASGTSVQHTYANAGTYHVHVYVVDAWGQMDETVYTLLVQAYNGKGTLRIRAEGDFGLAVNGTALGFTYKVWSSDGTTLITSGGLAPTTSVLTNFKDIALDANDYILELLFPPTAIGASTYHWCTGFNTSTTQSYTQAGVVVNAGLPTTVSGTLCQ